MMRLIIRFGFPLSSPSLSLSLSLSTRGSLSPVPSRTAKAVHMISRIVSLTSEIHVHGNNRYTFLVICAQIVTGMMAIKGTGLRNQNGNRRHAFAVTCEWR